MSPARTTLGVLLLVLAPAAALAADWADTLERVAPSVVAIQVDAARAFDTEWNVSTQATGFVVDAERGLILTNRHVVTPGPVTARAIFQNREEVVLQAVYRDPVHDFGFYRYDPASLRFAAPRALRLHPAGARVGTDIRVLGNDAGEQLSILAGTLARIDREAPDYGPGKYNDFNTFYLQAASSTSGGSSGSPVIDVTGKVVGLNAGGSTGAASSFYLPLARVARALALLQSGQAVTRGTLQVVFRYTPYDQLRRLGLTAETERRHRKRFPARTGMLVVAEVQPGSEAAGQLEVGDILTALDGSPVAEFDALAAQLDDSVGSRVSVEVERGGLARRVDLRVVDLETLSPASLLELGDTVLHDLSWQMARHLNLPVRGVYVANPGFLLTQAGVPRGAVIQELEGRPVAALGDLVEALAAVPQDQLVQVRYVRPEEPLNPRVSAVRMDRRWFPARTCRRDDAAGRWPCHDLPEPPVAEPGQAGQAASTRFDANGDPVLDALAPSLVQVRFDMPYSVLGITERNYRGTGVVVDAGRGLVLVDRNTVPTSLGVARLTFASTLELPARVAWIHPLHNLALLTYDPQALGDTPVRSVRLGEAGLRPADEAWAVGFKGDGRLVGQLTRVASLDPVDFPVSRTLAFREANLETLRLVNGPTDFDGVLADASGAVQAIWATFAYQDGRRTAQVGQGIAVEDVRSLIEAYDRDGIVQSLEVEWRPVSLAAARRMGLDDAWTRRISEHSPTRRSLLMAERVVAGSPAVGVVEPGDLLLAIDGRVVNTFREAEAATVAGLRQLLVWRAGAEVTLSVEPVGWSGSDLDRVLVWSGATLHDPHRAMSAQRGIEASGVFVAYFMFGSPASRFRLLAGRRITEVDGRPVTDLDGFMAEVADRPDGSSLRLKLVDWNGTPELITLTLDEHYWPAYLLERGTDGWARRRP
ncbi:MAG: trypsin-like peptidase domain-containing protein [Steroidobacteraceae bacterium]